MLSSFLLSRSTTKSGKGNVDTDLDAIFTASAKSAPLAPNEEATSDVNPSHKTSKRKWKDDLEAPVKPSKKHRSSGKEKASTTEESTAIPLDQDEDVVASTTESPKEKRKRKDTKKPRGKAKDHPIDDLEERYSSQRIEEDSPERKRKLPKINLSEPTPNTAIQKEESAKAAGAGSKEVVEDGSSDEDGVSMNLVHESISGITPVARRKSVYIPEGETKTDRDERTTFIGNLPFGILKSKSLQKALKRHILSFTSRHLESGTKIESIRFRSVAFKAPTNPQALKADGSAPKQGRQQDRAFSWRIGKDDDTGGEGSKPKVYLSPAEKKRVAFIKGEFHDQAASVNAYAVFAHRDPSQARESTSLDAMKPSEIAAVVVEQMDGTPFEGRTLRVDRVAVSNQTQGDAVVRDPASTVFVGNLEFTASEEELRIFFETLLTSEMGPPRRSPKSNGEGDEESDQPRTAHWVSSVRIIRDKDTQLGKGFGYVRFVERTCVDEVVAMDPVKLKFAKRKLRVTRCKATGDKTSSSPKKAGRHGVTSSGEMTTPRKAERPNLPKLKGDPKLGERLKDTSKEERREAKKQDANRLARRMEKKKARISLEKSLKKPEKERIRVRKATIVKTAKKKATKRTPA